MKRTLISLGLGSRTDIQVALVVGSLVHSWSLESRVKVKTDIPAHTYQLTFEPNHEWPEFYAKSTDIYKYWKKVAEKYGCMKYIKLQHQVVEARWVAEEAKWHVKVFLR